MRIAYLVNTYPSPSHSFIRREIKALERRGVEVVRFALRGNRAALVDPGDLAEDVRTEHVLAQGPLRILAATLAESIRSPARAIAAARLARDVWRRSDKGALHHAAYFAEAAYVARRCRMLGVAHLHAHFGTNSATVAMLSAALGGPPYSFTVHGPEEFDSPEALALGEKMRRAAFTVGVSSFGRSQLCRWTDASIWPRLRVVHCGVEPALFPPPAAMPDGPTRLVSIGRLVEQKGQLLLVDALAEAVGAGRDVRLTLVGDGPLRREIEARCRTLAVSDRVSITGWVDEARVRLELARAHALVMPSFAEGLPMVVMEAMAAGRPVISTYVAGIPELVRPGENGWLVPAGDAAALAGAIASLDETPRSTLEAMGRAGRALAFERHDVEREADRLAALFRKSAGEPDLAPSPIEDRPDAMPRDTADLAPPRALGR